MSIHVDWFERLTGFTESRYEETRRQLTVEGGQLISRVNGRSFGIGLFELPSLAQLRRRVVGQAARAQAEGGAGGFQGALKVSTVSGDVGAMHRDPSHAGALFQVASQFNVLEMAAPEITPEDGVTRYQWDATQGPTCALAAGAATIYRNYFLPVDGQIGQTAAVQIDALAPLGRFLSTALHLPQASLWTMRNGYAWARREGLEVLNTYLACLDESGRDALRSQLQIGLQWDVEVTSGPWPGPRVSQAFCSALPVGYMPHPDALWAPFAQLVLEASYEATVWAALLNKLRGVSGTVFLTQVGGGVFGNHGGWIEAAMDRALALAGACDLDVRLVSRHGTSPVLQQVCARAGERLSERAPRTSFTHPLQIAALPVGGQGGVLGVTFAPGKVQRNALSGAWARNLEVDLQAIREWGATHLVTLVEDHELRSLQIQALPERAQAHGLQWHHLPITDGEIPDQRLLQPWSTLRVRLVDALQRGERVVVHCRGGLGRAGTVACMLLRDAGVASVEEALQRVRAARSPEAVERGSQEGFLRTYQALR